MRRAGPPRAVTVGSGALRGRRLPVGGGARPTEGRVREALLSIWQDRLEGARVADLFAGSGAVGVEMLSRGAAFCLFVEGDRQQVGSLSRTLPSLLPGDRWRLLRLEVDPGTLARHLAPWPPFDLVFADPPYAWGRHVELVAALAPLLADGGEVAVEHAAREPLRAPEACGLTLVDSRSYGDTTLSRFAAR